MRISPRSPLESLLQQVQPMFVHEVSIDWDFKTDPFASTLPSGTRAYDDGKGGNVIKLPVLYYFVIIGHMGFAVIFAVLGGAIGKYMYGHAQKAETS